MARQLCFALTACPTFNALHSGKHNAEVQFCAFDVLALDGDDLRDLPLSMRKTNLERLLRGRPEGIFVNPFETGAIRYWARLFSRRLRHWCRGIGVKAQRSALSRRKVAALD